MEKIGINRYYEKSNLSIHTKFAGEGFLKVPLFSLERSLTGSSSCLMLDQVPPVIVIHSPIHCCSASQICKVWTMMDI